MAIENETKMWMDQQEQLGEDIINPPKDDFFDDMFNEAIGESKEKTEGKAQSPENPLILKENETPTGYKRIESSIKYVLKESEKEIKNLIESETKENQITEIKDLNAIIVRIKQIFSVNSLKSVITSIVKNNYLEGWDQAEKSMDKNFVPEAHAIDYLQKYTFDNVKGMETDIANKLRQELQRGYMEGEGIDKLKARVKSVFDVGDNRAEMIARTESNRASNTGQLQAYQKSGEKYNKIWITHFDDRTSVLCKRLDGQEVDINAKFKDSAATWEGMNPPSHVNCRSTMEFKPIIDKS